MKNVLFSLLILSIATSLSSQTAMPNLSKHSYKKPVMHSSKIGGFEEFQDKEDIVEIGTVLFNTKTNQVVGFIEEEKIDAEVSSSTAAISIDPHCERYPWITPYAYSLNNPIKFIDPDGRDVVDANGRIMYKNGCSTINVDEYQTPQKEVHFVEDNISIDYSSKVVNGYLNFTINITDESTGKSINEAFSVSTDKEDLSASISN